MKRLDILQFELIVGISRLNFVDYCMYLRSNRSEGVLRNDNRIILNCCNNRNKRQLRINKISCLQAELVSLGKQYSVKYSKWYRIRCAVNSIKASPVNKNCASQCC